MKKIYLSILILAVHITFSYSQATIKEWDEIKRENPDIHLDHLIRSDESGFYTLAIRTRGKGTDYYIEKYNKQGKMMFSQTIKDEPYYTLIAPKYLYLFYTTYDKDAGKKTLTYQKLSSESGEKLDEIELDELQSDEYGTYGRRFYMSLSPDKTKLLIVPQFKWAGKPEETRFKLYDAVTMKLIWEKQIPNEFEDYKIQTGSFHLDNEGNVLFIYQYAVVLDDFKSDDKVGGSLAVINVKSKTIHQIKISLPEDKLLTSHIINITESGTAVVAGVFKDPPIKGKKKKGAPKRRAGVYYASIDLKTAKLGNESTTYFTDGVNAKLTYKFDGSDAPGDKYIHATQIVEMDKSVYFIAENNYSITVSSNNGSSTTNYHNELIVSKINSSGSVVWMKVIPKSTSSRETGSLSDETASTNYNLLTLNSKMYIVYLDHPKNADKTVDNYDPERLGKVLGIRGPNVVCVSIDGDGNANKNVIHENEEFCMIPQVQDVLLDKSTLLVYMRKGKYEKFGTLVFQ